MQDLSVPSREVRTGPLRQFSSEAGDRPTWLGDEAVAGNVSDHHGGALYLLACIILGDQDKAETAAVRAIAQVCAQPGLLRVGGTQRQVLARLTYRHCLALRDSSPSTASGWGPNDAVRTPPLKAIDELRIVAHNQRTALALIEYGDHSCRDVADLLALPPATVAELIGGCLRELRAAARVSEAGHHPRDPFL